ncbi:MAG: hypothetical protein IJ207_01560 [Treponema sp.]|uniref:hypothetical protein n=1 Tax=Treponema sp. TaxID=166 RepID=UPI0025ECF26F|nr:hypothetical protein [Treponema sp.]MBQ9280872.1 hypothetical protein [Treponema sp.]
MTNLTTDITGTGRMKKRWIFFLPLLFLSAAIFASPSARDLRDLKVRPLSEVFFTQMENSYILEIPDVLPSRVQIDLPELPPGIHFVYSKKEECICKNGERGTQITLWFTFSESGQISLSPLFTKIDGKNHYFEFESVTVYENPNLISPRLEVNIQKPYGIKSDKKTGAKTLKVKKGELIQFTLSARYAVQILEFKWTLPKDSIFNETERFDFASGSERVTTFSADAKKIASFEWQILKEGTYHFPIFTIEGIAYNGSKKSLYLADNLEIVVAGESENRGPEKKSGNHWIYQDAFTKPMEENPQQKEDISRADFKKQADSMSLTIFQRLFARKYALFAGGVIFSIPEEKFAGQNFSGGQKVRIMEQAGGWAFIECKEFSGWTKNENLFLIR